MEDQQPRADHVERGVRITSGYYAALAGSAGGLWAFAVAYEGLTGPCPDPDDMCEGTMGDPYILIGFVLVVGLAMVAWGGVFAAVRAAILKANASRSGLLPWVAAVWWSVPSIIALNLYRGGASWLFAVVGVPVVLLARTDGHQAAVD